MSGYFSNFPTVQWSNTTVINIAERSAITRVVGANPRNWYPLTVPDGLRADRVAEAYYNNPYMAWLVYYGANTLDPYYGWPLDDMSLTNFIIDKYGSIVMAQQLIQYWQLNWAPFSDVTITPTYYFNNLTADLLPYYEPVFGTGGNIQAYRLRQEDWIETTNQFISIDIANVASGNAASANQGSVFNTIIADTGYAGGFLLDEPVFLLSGNTSNIVLGNGQICWLNSSSVTLQHLMGNVTTTGTTTIMGLVSNSLANVVSAGNITYNIAIDQQLYWAAVSCYQYELNINAARSHIQLVDSRFAAQAQTQLQALLNPNTSISGLKALTTITTSS